MICEGCIKQDTCKYKEVVEEYEADPPERLLDEPLEAIVQCKYKQTYPPLPGCDITNPAPADWDTTTDIDTDNITYTS